MTQHNRRQSQASTLRLVRKIHRYTGASLFALFLVISMTGLLLGWKKNSGGYLLPDTAKGRSTDVQEWLPVAALQDKALAVLDSLHPELDATIDRIDLRPDKGVAKFSFKNHYQEIQIDGTTGEVLRSATRRSDFLEQLHDGSLVDRYLGIGWFKLLYTSLSGLALLTFTITGFWLWYGPKRMRNNK